MSIRARIRNGVNPALPTDDDRPFRLVHRPSNLMTQVETEISADGTFIVSTATLDDAHDLTLLLTGSSPISELPSGARDTVKVVFRDLQRLNQLVFGLTVQELRLYDERHLMSGPQQWSRDGTTWHELAHEIRITGEEMYPVYQLDAEWTGHVQELVRAGEQQFHATQHLHEARRRRSPRFRWIEATTAAELAIKEALLRMEPKLEPLLAGSAITVTS